MSIVLGNPVWSYAFLALVPLVILYLIKPKPKNLTIPSLMFILRTSGKNVINSFLRALVTDLIFIIQLLIIALLAFSLTDPILKIKQDVVSENAVFIIDVSASSNVNENPGTRFELGLKKIESLLGNRNTIILAKNFPETVLQDKGRRETLNFLRTLKPSHTPSNIGDAMAQAANLLQGRKGRVVVVSDFINTGGLVPETAKGILESQGNHVDYINTINERRSNIGFVKLDVTPESAIAFIKNFNNKDEDVRIKVNNDEKDIKIKANSVEPLAFKPNEGLTKIDIINEDDLLADNSLYLKMPSKKLLKVLFITNDRKKSIYLASALKATGRVEVGYTEPPIITKGKYDLYVIDSIDKEHVIKGIFEELLQEVKKGSNLIVQAQPDSDALGYDILLPVKLDFKSGSAGINVDLVNDITRNMDFGRVTSYFVSDLKNGSVSLASAANSSVIALSSYGSGKIVYFGILNDASEFKLSPYYPIFWLNMIRFVSGEERIKDVNAVTGSKLILNGQLDIKTPSASFRSDNLAFNEVGLYKIGDKEVVANLVNEDESNVNSKEVIGRKIEDFKFEPVEEQIDMNLDKILLYSVLALLFIELLLTKIRGEI
ncbi:BatA domain-containing protein [Candidatus Woesearchaeota archaeon]|nr:BatA domain-containing protein [Candidatus Woesearchaeota archaeon]